MPQLIVRKLEQTVVRKLKERAGRNGVSMEEEHRRILRQALLSQKRKKPSLKEYLLQMPDIGPDALFEQGPRREREVEL